MPSKPNNIIGKLRQRYEPHMQLSAKVDLNHTIIHEVEKKLSDLPKVHKTLSKSFVMQRKTLVRVLGLEGRVSELESQQAAEEQAKEGIDEILDELGVGGEQETETEAGGDQESEVGGDQEEEKVGGIKTRTYTATKPKDKSKTKKKKFKIKKKKIRAKDIGFKSRVFGEDASGGYLSPEERKRRFKLGDKQPAGELSTTVTDSSDGEQSTTQTSPISDGLLNAVRGIAESVDRIKDSLLNQGKVQKSAAEKSRKAGEEKEAKKRESGLEKLMGPVKAAGEKILAPIKSIFGQIWDFFTTILLGRMAFKLFEWMSNPKNTDKITSIFKFIKDWWPLIVGQMMLVLGPGVIFAVGISALLAWGIIKITDAVKSIFGFGKDIDKELKTGSDNLNKTVDKAGKDAEKKLEPGKEDLTKGAPEGETPAELSNVQNSAQQVQNQKVPGLNKGGQVPGRGPNKDTVPAMLTPGEFVMSRDAVEQYGVNTLEGMNAAAGGTNIPTFQKNDDKKMNMNVPRLSGGGSPSGGGSGGNASEKNLSGTGKEWGDDTADLVKLVGPPLKEWMDHHNSIIDSDPEFFGEHMRVEMDRDGKMMNFGKTIANMSEWAFNESVKNLQANEAIPPEAKEAIMEQIMWIKRQTLDDPNFKSDLAFDINKDIPGTAANRLFARAKADTSSPAALAGISARDRALQMNKLGYAGGGLVGRLKDAGAMVLGHTKSQISKLQKPRGDHLHLAPPKPLSSSTQSLASQMSKSAEDMPAEMTPAPGIPNFDAGMMRSQSKIRTLGVSV